MLRVDHAATLHRAHSWPAASAASLACGSVSTPFTRRGSSIAPTAQLSASTRRCAHPSFRPFSASAARISPPSRRQTVVRANWGAPVNFSSAKVQSSNQVAPGMFKVLVDVGADIAAGYAKPGQYIQAKVSEEAKAGFFAIASAPGGGSSLELLIKAAPGSSAEAITALPAGGSLLVSPVQGKGFPLDRIPADKVDTVLLFATGSGISPLKAVIESGALHTKSRKEVRLYYGTKAKGSTAYQELIPEWEKAGVKVVQVFSEDKKRYVQSVLAQEVESGHFAGDHASKIGVLLCGQKDMCGAVTTILTEKGVDKEKILLNF